MAAVREVGPAGHFLGTKHTLDHFESAFFMPTVMDFNPFEQWSAEGAKDHDTRGREKAAAMLAAYEEPPWTRALPRLEGFHCAARVRIAEHCELGKLQIFVDADACPVKEEVARVAARHTLVIHYVSNSHMRLPFGDNVNVLWWRKGRMRPTTGSLNSAP